MKFMRKLLQEESVYSAIVHLRKRGVPVTLSRLGEYLAYNETSIREHLENLRRKGFIEHEKNKCGNYKVVGNKKDS